MRYLIVLLATFLSGCVTNQSSSNYVEMPLGKWCTPTGVSYALQDFNKKTQFNYAEIPTHVDIKDLTFHEVEQVLSRNGVCYYESTPLYDVDGLKITSWRIEKWTGTIGEDKYEGSVWVRFMNGNVIGSWSNKSSLENLNDLIHAYRTEKTKIQPVAENTDKENKPESVTGWEQWDVVKSDIYTPPEIDGKPVYRISKNEWDNLTAERKQHLEMTSSLIVTNTSQRSYDYRITKSDWNKLSSEQQAEIRENYMVVFIPSQKRIKKKSQPLNNFSGLSSKTKEELFTEENEKLLSKAKAGKITFYEAAERSSEKYYSLFPELKSSPYLSEYFAYTKLIGERLDNKKITYAEAEYMITQKQTELAEKIDAANKQLQAQQDQQRQIEDQQETYRRQQQAQQAALEKQAKQQRAANLFNMGMSILNYENERVKALNSNRSGMCMGHWVGNMWVTQCP